MTCSVPVFTRVVALIGVNVDHLVLRGREFEHATAMFHEANVVGIVVNVVGFGKRADEVGFLDTCGKGFPHLGVLVGEPERSVGRVVELDATGVVGFDFVESAQSGELDVVRGDIDHGVGPTGAHFDHGVEDRADAHFEVVLLVSRAVVDLADEGVLFLKRNVVVLIQGEIGGRKVMVVKGAGTVEMEVGVVHASQVGDSFAKITVVGGARGEIEHEV